MANDWTREQLLVALGLYCEIPFGKYHSKNPRIEEVSQKIGRSAGALAMRLGNFASLDPAITGTRRSGLKHISKGARSIWEEFLSNTDEIMPEVAEEMVRFGVDRKIVRADYVDGSQTRDYSSSDYLVWSKERKGQELFRTSVLSAYYFRCCVTGIEDNRFLVASHIVPWSKDPQNRLNPKNGLCLNSIHDRAFDLGLISFSKRLRLLVSSEIDAQRENWFIEESFLACKGQKMLLPGKFFPDTEFLEWHRNNQVIE